MKYLLLFVAVTLSASSTICYTKKQTIKENLYVLKYESDDASDKQYLAFRNTIKRDIEYVQKNCGVPKDTYVKYKDLL